VRGAVLCATLWCLAPALVCAQEAEPESPPADARALFERGIEYSDQERWGEAVEYFRRSWALLERPSTAYNLAVALLRLGQPTGALDALEDFLRVADGDDSRRPRARELLETALAAIAHVTMTVEPATAVVRVDGSLVGGEGPVRELRLDPGQHNVRVEAEHHEPEAITIAVVDGERVQRSVTLAHLPEPTGPATLRVTSAVAGASILVDGVEVGQGTYVDELEAGEHVVEVRASGHQPFRRTLLLSAGERHDLHASLLEDGSGGLLEDPVFWLVVGGAALLVGGAIAIGVAVGSQPDAPYGGNTDVILQGLRF